MCQTTHCGRRKKELNEWAWVANVPNDSLWSQTNRTESTASTPGQNVHLVLPHNHVVVSSSHLANSSSQLILSSSLSQSVVELSRHVVESSRRLVVSSSHLVVSSFLTYCLVVPLLVYSSTRRITFQLVMSPFNSSCNALVHCSWRKRGRKGPGYYN